MLHLVIKVKYIINANSLFKKKNVYMTMGFHGSSMSDDIIFHFNINPLKMGITYSNLLYYIFFQ